MIQGVGLMRRECVTPNISQFFKGEKHQLNMVMKNGIYISGNYLQNSKK